jgi:hypothetical protein
VWFDRPGVRLGDLFAVWGERLGPTQLLSFAGSPVRVYVNGRRRRNDPRTLALEDGAQIVLQLGPYIPPHTRFLFP